MNRSVCIHPVLHILYCSHLPITSLSLQFGKVTLSHPPWTSFFFSLFLFPLPNLNINWLHIWPILFLSPICPTVFKFFLGPPTIPLSGIFPFVNFHFFYSLDLSTLDTFTSFGLGGFFWQNPLPPHCRKNSVFLLINPQNQSDSRNKELYCLFLPTLHASTPYPLCFCW